MRNLGVTVYGLATFINGLTFGRIRSMGVLVVKCPINGRYFSTGVQTDADSFALMPNEVAYARCPHCRTTHSWRPLDAKLVDAIPPSDWIENQR